MSARDIIDSTRKAFVNSKSAPTRAIVYKRSSDDSEISLNSFVSNVEFNQDGDDDKKVNRISCKALILEEKPTRTDQIIYNGETYNVRLWDKMGDTYNIEADIKRNKVSSRKFK